MRLFGIFNIIIAVAVATSVPLRSLAGSEPSASVQRTIASIATGAEESVRNAGGRSFYILKTDTGFDVGVQEKDGNRYRLLAPTRIDTVSEFSQNSRIANAPWSKLSIKNSAGLAAEFQNWFFFSSEKGLHLMRVTGDNDSPVKLFTFPEAHGKVTRVTSSIAKTAEGKRYVLFSYETEDKSGVTYFFDTGDSTASKLTESFIDLEKGGQSDATFVGGELHFASRPDLRINFTHPHPSVPTHPALMNLQATSSQSQSKSGSRPPTSFTQPNLQPHQPSGNSLDASNLNLQAKARELIEQAAAAHGDLNNPNIPFRPTHAAASGGQTHTGSTVSVPESDQGAEPKVEPLPPGANRLEMTYKDVKYLLYTSIDPTNPGTFIQRETTDKLTVKVSTEAVPLADAKGDARIAVKIEDGILHHPALVRMIDMDAFELETKFIPRKNSKANVEWLRDQFENAKTDGSLVVKPVKSRADVVDTVLKNILRPTRANTILTSDVGDNKDVLREVAGRLPRTWDYRILDSAVVGADTSMLGQREKKIRQMRDAWMTVPIIWEGENFDHLKGVGVTEGNKKDFLDDTQMDLRDGYFRVLGTGSSEFSTLVTDPNILKSLTRIELPPLSDPEVEEALHLWLDANPKYGKMPPEYVTEIRQVAAKFNVTEEEPTRTIKLSERVLSILYDEGKLGDTSAFTKEILDRAIVEEYQSDPAMRNLQILRLRLTQFHSKMSEQIMGHEHLLELIYEQVQNAMAGLHDGRGPGVSVFIDGPPGTGKTELALALGNSLGLRTEVIEMSQYNGSDAETIKNFIKHVGSVANANPFTVFVFDELEKSSKEVQNTLLSAMSKKTFTYRVDGRVRKSSLANCMAFGTSNAAGDHVAEYFSGLDRKKQSESSVDLENDFFKRVPFKDFEAIVTQKVSKPLFDRFQNKTVTFPPSLGNLIKILAMKLKGIRKMVSQSAMNYTPRFVDEKPYLEELADKAMSEGLSTRTVIDKLSAHARRRASDMLFQNYTRGQEHDLHLMGPHSCPAALTPGGTP